MRSIDGVIFLFSLDSPETFAAIEENITYYMNAIQPIAAAEGKKVGRTLYSCLQYWSATNLIF
jgi:hypothetical protein